MSLQILHFFGIELPSAVASRHELEAEIGRIAQEGRRKGGASKAAEDTASDRTSSQVSPLTPSQQASASGNISSAATSARFSVLSEHMSELMGDAPFCDNCGHITVRNGACYKCLNCGASLGCS